MERLVAKKFCETCGSSVELDMPSGFCPGCLLNTVLETQSESATASRIDDYELLNEVARGGMGIVYRAKQRAPSRIIALKMILPAHLNSPGAVNRFRAEAEAAASLDHENILPIYAVGEADGAPFYSMKFAKGGTLSAKIDKYRDKAREAAALIAKLARAVAFAHEHGILHRDLKPGNVLFDSAGKPYVSDFGLAKWLQRECDLTQTLAILGTPYYMAPEQATDSRGVTASADVYSLGAILYHLLTGRPPFAGETPMEVLHRAETESPKPPRLTNQHVPRDLETICLKCLAKEPATRYASAAALAEDLERWLKHQPIRAKRSGFVTRGRKWVRRNPTTAVLAALLIALAASVSFTVWNRRLAVIIPKSVAVLPFENLSNDANNAYFADGIQEEILTRLAGIADLKVISRTSTQQYQSKPRNLSQIAKQLGVAHILEGRVQKAADQVRVNVQLINAQTDSHLWADTYDRKLTDIFGVESEIAETIADTLQAKLTGLEKKQMSKKTTENPEAYELYLRGRFFWNKRTSADMKTALSYFEQAASVDPKYAVAYGGMADCYLLLPLYGGGVPAEMSPKAIAMAQKAISLDPTLGEPHASLGLVHSLFDFDFAASVREFEEAIRLNPNYAIAHHWFGDSTLPALGQFDRANAEAKRALELDPLSLVMITDAGTVYWITGRYQEAVAQFRKAIEIDPGNYTAHWQLGQALECIGDLPGAIAEYEKSTQLDADPLPLGLLAAARAKAGDRPAALAILNRIQETAKRRYVSDYSFALIHLALGQKDEALHWLESSYAKHQPDLNWIRVDPDLRPLHGDPAFEALAEKIVPAREFNASATSK